MTDTLVGVNADLKKALVQPTYVPKLHFGQVNLYTRQDRIDSGRVSLKENMLPIVRGFLKTNLKST